MSAYTLGLFEWIQRTIWTNSIATIILVPVVLLLCRVFQRRPAVQHLLWLLLLVKFMTPQVPGFAWVIPESIARFQWPQESPVNQDRIVLAEETNFHGSDSFVEPVEAMAFNESMNKAKATEDIAESLEPTWAISVVHHVEMVVFGAWAAGAGYFLVSIALGLRNQRHILKRSTAPGPRLSQIVNEVAFGLGLRKLVSVVSPDIRSPFISCLCYVRLVWPRSLSASEPTSLRSLIAHEAAHVRRLDHYVAWLELIATIVWWWNPVFWLVRHRLRVTAEMACDAIALDAFPDDRCIYAEKLLELSACFKTGAPPLVLAVGGGTPSSIERRITMIVSDRVSCKASILGLLVVAVVGMSVLPSWTFGQCAPNPSEPEPVSWLLDPFMRRFPPPPRPIQATQPTANQQAATTAPMLSNQNKLVLRLKAMYLLALSEDRTNDAEALAAAITEMTRPRSTDGRAESSDMPDGPGPVEEERGGPSGGGSELRWKPDSASNQSFRENWDNPVIIDRHNDGNYGGSSLDRTEIILDLGPRRNWAVERYNLHRSLALGQFRSYEGLAVRIRVTGERSGPVWGSNPYSDDSSLHSAALHSGLVKEGQTTDVVAIIRPGQASYAGSESHGITTNDFGPYPGSFELVPVSQCPDAPYLCDRSVLRNSSDNYLSLNKLAGQAQLKPGVSLIVPLHAKAGAPIVGTDQYASDNNLDATAIHAGVLKDGASGYVKIILDEGLDSYVGSKQNGIESYPYGKTKMSIRFEKLSVQPKNSLPALSLNEQRLRVVELNADGLGTAFVDEDVVRAIEAVSEAKKAEPSTGSPGMPNEPRTAEQPQSGFEEVKP